MNLPYRLLLTVLLLSTPALLDAQPVYRFETAGQKAISASEESSLFYPSGVAVEPDGTVWIADTANHVIRRMRPDGTWEIVAGQNGVAGTENGPAALATFRYPQGLVFDAEGNLYIADSGNGLIRRLRTDDVVETWAGDPEERGTINGDRFKARFVTPIGLAWDVTGDLWISDFSAHTIRRIGIDGEVDTISGIHGTPGFTNGNGEDSTFYYPSGIDIDAQGRLWVADSGNGAIRVVSRDGFTESIAGVDGVQEHRDGALEISGFNHPSDLAISTDGTVFVTDSWSHTIRIITAEEVRTVAGSPGEAGFADGRGSSVRFNHPLAIALSPDGLILVADMVNHELRQGTEDQFGSGRRRTIGR